jgi:hypothetical protein
LSAVKLSQRPPESLSWNEFQRVHSGHRGASMATLWREHKLRLSSRKAAKESEVASKL